MGEEIRDPARNIPRAVIATLIATFVVYLVVALAIVALVASPHGAHVVGAGNSLSDLLGNAQAGSVTVSIVQAGAMIAMLGVLLNLVLGLSRVVLAMARRNDLPTSFAKLSADGESPHRAVLLVAVMIGLLTLSGDILRTWSISAFAVLIYYATANLCALRQPPEERRYPRLVSVGGLVGCLSLVPFIDSKTIVSGTVLMVSGLVVKLIADFQKRKRPVT